MSDTGGAAAPPPVWGDAADLIDVLDVRPAGEGCFVSVTRPNPARPVVEASQMLGQAIVAAGKTVPGRRVVSAHMVFTRMVGTDVPLRFSLDPVSTGRTFAALRVGVTQEEDASGNDGTRDGRLCASGTMLLHAPEEDLIRHSVAPPQTADPTNSEPYDMAVTGRDIRMVDGAYTDDPDAPVGPPVIDSWVRFDEVRPEQYIHAGLLAQYTGHISIAAAMRPHAGVGQRDAHRTLSTGINAISISFHSDVRADRWMLYRHLSTFAGEGMTHSECRVHGEDGALLASFSVDAMVRPLADGRGRVIL